MSLTRYQSSDEDSGRWVGFPFRDGDIVISTRSKTGTTWLQMICALLVFQTPDLPAPLTRISPWLDWLTAPREDVYARLAAQQHRRLIKTHTPLDGLPVDPRVTYLVTARHPLDIAVSLYHHSANIDRVRLSELTGIVSTDHPQRTLREAVLRWIGWDGDPRDNLDSLPGVMFHVSDAWQRRTTADVLLVHYQDLVTDLDGEMRRVAGRLGIAVDESVWPSLVRAATFGEMRARAGELAPDAGGVLKDKAAFFRRGGSGAGREVLTDEEVLRYERRAAELAPPAVLEWLHR
jgi:hypothetical protein